MSDLALWWDCALSTGLHVCVCPCPKSWFTQVCAAPRVEAWPRGAKGCRYQLPESELLPGWHGALLALRQEEFFLPPLLPSPRLRPAAPLTEPVAGSGSPRWVVPWAGSRGPSCLPGSVADLLWDPGSSRILLPHFLTENSGGGVRWE